MPGSRNGSSSTATLIVRMSTGSRSRMINRPFARGEALSWRDGPSLSWSQAEKSIIYQELVALVLALSAQGHCDGGGRLPEYIRPSLDDFDAPPESCLASVFGPLVSSKQFLRLRGVSKQKIVGASTLPCETLVKAKQPFEADAYLNRPLFDRFPRLGAYMPHCAAAALFHPLQYAPYRTGSFPQAKMQRSTAG